MGVPPADAVDLISMLERALDDASSGLKLAATEMGAEAVTVLFCEGSNVEITYAWHSIPPTPQKRQLPTISAAHCDVLKKTAGPAEAGSPVAQILRDFIAPRSQSFLLFTWRMQQRVVTVAFCFAATQPPNRQAPDAVLEKISLIGLATWSVKEIAGLRSQLKTVNNRLAGRKLVERAKGLLQIDKGISEEGAYEHLRRLSRKRRITLAALAEEVVRERGRTQEQSPGESEIASGCP